MSRSSCVSKLETIAQEHESINTHIPSLDQSTREVQACVCELCGSLTSHYASHYRDTAKIHYRVQQHIRRFVPELIEMQTGSLSSCRALQRDILDMNDSIQMLNALHGPVRSHLHSVSTLAAHSSTVLDQIDKEIKLQAFTNQHPSMLTKGAAHKNFQSMSATSSPMKPMSAHSRAHLRTLSALPSNYVWHSTDMEWKGEPMQEEEKGSMVEERRKAQLSPATGINT